MNRHLLRALFVLTVWIACAPAAISNPEVRVIPDERNHRREEVTSVAVPDKPGVTYVIRWAVNCTTASGACEPDSATSRLRLEDSTGFGKRIYFEANPALTPVDPKAWVATPTLFLYRQKAPNGIGTRVVQVSLPVGRVIDDTTFENWITPQGWAAPGALAFLGHYSLGSPKPYSVMDAEGRITQIVGSDWYRLRENRATFPDCRAMSNDAAYPPEALVAFLPGRPYTELQRRAAVNGQLVTPSFSLEGSGDEICARYQTHFWIGRRSDGTGWHALAYGGRVLANGKVFPTVADAEQAGINEISSRQGRDSVLSATNQQAANPQANQALQEQESLARLRSRVQALWSAGSYREAATAAEELKTDEYASYLLRSPVADIADYKAATEKLRKRGHTLSWDPLVLRLNERINEYSLCRIRNQESQVILRWESLAPNDQFNLIVSGPPRGSLSPGPGQRYVFDATAFEWRLVSGPRTTSSNYGYEVVNRPKTLTPQERAARAAELTNCYAAVRARAR